MKKIILNSKQDEQKIKVLKNGAIYHILFIFFRWNSLRRRVKSIYRKIAQGLISFSICSLTYAEEYE